VLKSRGLRWNLMLFLPILICVWLMSVNAQERMNNTALELQKILKIEEPNTRIDALKDFAERHPKLNSKLPAYSAIFDTYRELNDSQPTETFAREILAKETQLKIRQLAYGNLLSIFQETDGNKLEVLARSIIQTESAPILLSSAYDGLVAYYSEYAVDSLETLANEMLRIRLINGMTCNNLAWSLIESDLNPELGLQLALFGDEQLTAANFTKLYPDLSEDQVQEYLRQYRGYIKDTIGWGYYKIGQNDLAEKYLEEALTLYNAPDAEVSLHLGTVLAVLGQNDRAIKVLTAALMVNQSEEGLALLAELLGKTTAETEAYLQKQQLAVAQPAEDFTLNDLNGQSHTLSNYHGNVVIVNFFSPT